MSSRGMMFLFLYLVLVDNFTAVLARPVVRSIKSTHEFNRLLEKHAKETGLPVIADFYSDGCGPCRMMAPIFKKLAKEKKDEAVFVKIDTQAQYQLAGQYNIRSIPTFIFFHEGKKVNEFGGAGEGQLRQYTDMVIGKAKDENIKLTAENLQKFYSKQGAEKSDSDIKSILNKCSGSKKKSADECVGASAFKLVRQLRKKYRQTPELLPRFEPITDGESSSDSKDKDTPKSKESNKSKSGSSSKTANLHLATLEQLQEEVERRLDELRDAEVDSEEDSDDFDEDAHAFKSGPFPQPVTIIGGGPAGLSASIYAARSGLKPVVIAPPMGGQLLGKGVDVENYPGLSNVTGPEVIAHMRAQAIDFGTSFVADVVTKIDSSERPFKVFVNETDKPIMTHSIIVATGAESNWLGIPGEYELRGGGVSSCAICDGSIYAGKDVIIVGGGDAAMEDALVLARTSKSVTVAHRRDTFRASKILAERVKEHPLISIKWNTVVKEIIGEDVDETKKVVKAAVLSNVESDEEETVPIDAVFVAIGHTPATNFLKGIVEYNEEHKGYLKTFDESTRTSVHGIFASGDVSDAIYRQAITSAGSGAAAALDAERWLSEMGLGNEEAELEAALMAELMEESDEPKETYNAYADVSSSGNKKKIKKKAEDRIEEDDESVLEL